MGVGGATDGGAAPPRFGMAAPGSGFFWQHNHIANG